MESLLSIWKRHEGAKGLDNWWRYPHAPGAHERMKAEARQYAQNLLREERPDLWPIFARGDVGDLCDLWLEQYAGEYDGELPGNTNRARPATWADGAAAEYVKEYNRPHDDCNHIRGVGVVALQYFAEYVTAALERYGVEWGQQEQDEGNTPGGIVLPQELDTPESKDYFKKAVALGLMDENYKWRYGLQMLSCFARDMSLRLHLGKGVNADNTERISWKPFETLFKLKPGTLRSNYNDIQKTGQNPKGAHLIDRLFK